MKTIVALLLILAGPAWAESLKVTMSYPNHEEKVFRFQDTEGAKILEIGTKKSVCTVGFRMLPQVNYFEISCSPSAELKKKSSLSYATRIVCGPSSLNGMVLDEENSGKVTTTLIKAECEP